MRKTSLPTRSIVPGGPLPSVLEDAHQRRHDEEEEDDDDESETLLLSRKDANATRRRFDALEEEEENDVHRPPGLSHAAMREDGDGDAGDDSSGDDDDDDDDENLDRFFSRLYQQFVGKGFLGILCARIANALILLFTIWMSGFLLLCVDWQCLRTTCAENAEHCDIVRDCVVIRHPLRGSKRFIKDAIVCSYLALATAYLCWNMARLVHDLPELREMR